VGDLVGNQLHTLQIARKIKEHTAPLIWADVVGAQVAGATQVLGIDGGVLRVSTKSSVWASELNFYKADIVRRLNGRLGAPAGDPYIRDILFQNRGIRPIEEVVETPAGPSYDELESIPLSPTELRLIEEGMTAVSDETLKARMRRVRIADARLRTWRLDNGWVPCARCGDLCPPFLRAETLDCRRCRLLGA
jgi:predicted nucleic acid-binding Zn ribbon protein